ncbi:MAG: pyridoxal phosphate-dependent aminotransferase family protein, partial [Acidobacteria bacterium]|nr:pyridoxal phosphate-dependent aminotransferase family protein [Acidobacteriota bacterium]
MKENDTLSYGASVVSARSSDRFNGFFSNGKNWNCNKDSLTDARARGIFELMGAAHDAGVYPFQVPLEGRSGPWVQVDGRRLMMLSSYDYLGLIGDPRIDEAAIEAVRKYGTGTGGVRMLTGTIDLHREMERELAAFKGTPESITFSSGYLANLAVIAALLTPQDRVVMDALSHRSLVDAARLAGVQIQRFKHNDANSLEGELKAPNKARRTLIISDGVFSMDGDIGILPQLVELKKQFGCFLLIDESHSTGVLGRSGRGTDEHFGIPTSDVDIWTGSLAKAIPSNGGFAAVSQDIGIFLQHAAAPFIFSAALCPAAVAAVRQTLMILQQEPERVARITRNADILRSGLQELGYNVGVSETAIIPVIFGGEPATAFFTARLRENGILVTPIMFPAVPQGTARLRLCVTAAHTEDDLG